MKVLATFSVPATVHLNEAQLRESIKKLNLFYTGDTECNIRRGNDWVSKYPKIEKERPEFQQSHYNIHRDFQFKIKVELMENGTLRIKK